MNLGELTGSAKVFGGGYFRHSMAQGRKGKVGRLEMLFPTVQPTNPVLFRVKSPPEATIGDGSLRPNVACP